MSEGGDGQVKGEADHVALIVVAQDGAEIHFKIRRNTPLQKLFSSFCQRQGVQENQYKFLYDGQRLRGEQTPAQLGMEDSDLIDAMLQQVGGARQ
eukprot:CAMPEP_0201515710 /NCGR_PEP_ID=MMETSP0161_2-20130828/7208_1 /ASSEMBLY_ACC=CAM_ASM_000251 /TAXON_ID=180227 /ORGANISM="Neoparamoeba aestuarina, Strain SoJaBio B1-5/56/2" /LENGTH=94 /DNA_ID=CAMNT_0047912615 /DNA_START=80 /DNA_END=364 /DNA_ORIENTATION=+